MASSYASRKANPDLHSCTLQMGRNAELAAFSQQLCAMGPRVVHAFLAEIICGASLADAMTAYGAIDANSYRRLSANAKIGSSACR